MVAQDPFSPRTADRDYVLRRDQTPRYDPARSIFAAADEAEGELFRSRAVAHQAAVLAQRAAAVPGEIASPSDSIPSQPQSAKIIKKQIKIADF